ncbi:MAG: secretin N-terminal domain-containing protein, partial [Aquabacterium sp.]
MNAIAYLRRAWPWAAAWLIAGMAQAQPAQPSAAPVPTPTAGAADPTAGMRPVRPEPRTTGHSAALKSRTPVTVNFVNADVEAVTRAMAAMLDRQLVLDPRVKGTITVYSEQPILPREAYLTYLAALRGIGFTVVDNNGLLKVVPEADAKLQAGTVSVGPGVTVRGDQVITQIFPLKHENPNNLVAVLRPLISPNNTINASPATTSLVITDYADNLQRIARIIAALDQPTASEFEVLGLKHAVAADLAPVVQRLSDTAGSGAPGIPVAASGIVILPDSRSNALLVRAPGARMAGIKDLVDKLDRPSAGAHGTGSVWVVHLRNADAVKLAQVLRAAYGGGAGGSAGGGGLAPSVPSAPGVGAAPSQSAAPVAASA